MEYFEPGDVDGLATLMARHADEPGHTDRRRSRLDGYEPRSWADIVVDIASVVAPPTISR
ncbi:MAG: hypothetical protein R2698_01875 [Microthrixaceae bacterium]